MTSISAVSSSAQWPQPTRPAPEEPGQDTGPLASVSQLLGSSVSELQTELSTGKSLDDIAAAQGVSHDDLISALQAGQPADAPQGVQGLEQMAAQAGGPRPPLPPAQAPDSSQTGVLTGSVTERQQTLLDQLSELLQTDSEDLAADLQGGADLAQMLADRGITRSDAAATVGEGFLLDTRA